jgi:hypothetical protein
MAMIAMTTSNSISVNVRPFLFPKKAGSAKG